MFTNCYQLFYKKNNVFKVNSIYKTEMILSFSKNKKMSLLIKCVNILQDSIIVLNRIC